MHQLRWISTQWVNSTKIDKAWLHTSHQHKGTTPHQQRGNSMETPGVTAKTRHTENRNAVSDSSCAVWQQCGLCCSHTTHSHVLCTWFLPLPGIATTSLLLAPPMWKRTFTVCSHMQRQTHILINGPELFQVKLWCVKMQYGCNRGLVTVTCHAHHWNTNTRIQYEQKKYYQYKDVYLCVCFVSLNVCVCVCVHMCMCVRACMQCMCMFVFMFLHAWVHVCWILMCVNITVMLPLCSLLDAVLRGWLRLGYRSNWCQYP